MCSQLSGSTYGLVGFACFLVHVFLCVFPAPLHARVRKVPRALHFAWSEGLCASPRRPSGDAPQKSGVRWPHRQRCSHAGSPSQQSKLRWPQGQRCVALAPAEKLAGCLSAWCDATAKSRKTERKYSAVNPPSRLRYRK